MGAAATRMPVPASEEPARRSLGPPETIGRLDTRILIELLRYKERRYDAGSISGKIGYTKEQVEGRLNKLVWWRYVGRNMIHLAASERIARQKLREVGYHSIQSEIRNKIVHELASGPRTPLQLVELVGCTDSGIRSALRMLEEHKLIKVFPLFITDAGMEALHTSPYIGEYMLNTEPVRLLRALRDRASLTPNRVVHVGTLAGRLGRSRMAVLRVAGELEEQDNVRIIGDSIALSDRVVVNLRRGQQAMAEAKRRLQS